MMSCHLNAQNTCTDAFEADNFKDALTLCEKEISSQKNQSNAELLLKLVDISNELDLKEHGSAQESCFII